MNKTEHFGLNQWDGTDRILRADFNADNATIDKTLSELAATAAQSARLLQYAGNCDISIMSYTGTGTSGAKGPTELRIGARPMFFMIHGSQVLILCGGMLRATCIHPGSDGKTAVIEVLNLAWNAAENIYTFYASNARDQANLADTTYEVIRFYRAE